jgi:hypothetical protein
VFVWDVVEKDVSFGRARVISPQKIDSLISLLAKNPHQTNRPPDTQQRKFDEATAFNGRSSLQQIRPSSLLYYLFESIFNSQ